VWKFKHVTAWQLVGVQPPKSDVVLQSARSLRIVFTADIAPFVVEADRARVVPEMLLRGEAGEGAALRLRSNVEKVRRQRPDRGAWLVFEMTGDAQPVDTTGAADWEDVRVLPIPATESPGHASSYSPDAPTVRRLAGAAAAILQPRQMRQFASNTALLDDAGRQVYATRLVIPGAELFLSEVPDPVLLGQSKKLFGRLDTDLRLNSALELLAASQDDCFDDQREFHISWVAVEAFAKALRKDYKAKYKTIVSSPIGGGQLLTIQTNTSKQNGSISKTMVALAYIFVCLDPAGAEADFDEVDRIRDQRNDYVHSQPDSKLQHGPESRRLRAILFKYVLLHLQGGARTA
jgi:hypothetical protein